MFYVTQVNVKQTEISTICTSGFGDSEKTQDKKSVPFSSLPVSKKAAFKAKLQKLQSVDHTFMTTDLKELIKETSDKHAMTEKDLEYLGLQSVVEKRELIQWYFLQVKRAVYCLSLHSLNMYIKAA